jgi:hypothetical protein
MSRRRTSLIMAAVTASLLLGLGVATVSAKSPMAAFTDTVTLTGDQEVWANPACAPPMVCGDPDATGTAKIVVSPAADRVCFNISWTAVNGDVWGAHIHGPATTAQTAPIRVGFLMLTPGAEDNLGSDERIAGCAIAPPVTPGGEETWADRIAANPGMFYVNVHSSPNFNPGAIRGQLGD